MLISSKRFLNIHATCFTLKQVHDIIITHGLFVNTFKVIQEGLPGSMETWTVEKKVCIVSVLILQSHNGFIISWKQCLIWWSWRWLRLSRNLFRSLIPYGLWILKILFGNGRIKFSRFFLKIKRLPDFLIWQSRLFHSDIVEGKNEFLK